MAWLRQQRQKKVANILKRALPQKRKMPLSLH
jgi:hypothetical protein